MNLNLRGLATCRYLCKYADDLRCLPVRLYRIVLQRMLDEPSQVEIDPEFEGFGDSELGPQTLDRKWILNLEWRAVKFMSYGQWRIKLIGKCIQEFKAFSLRLGDAYGAIQHNVWIISANQAPGAGLHFIRGCLGGSYEVPTWCEFSVVIRFRAAL